MPDEEKIWIRCPNYDAMSNRTKKTKCVSCKYGNYFNIDCLWEGRADHIMQIRQTVKRRRRENGGRGYVILRCEAIAETTQFMEVRDDDSI